MALDLEELLPELLIQAPRCPEPYALKCLRDAARKFCMATEIWKESDQFTVCTPDCEGLTTVPEADIVRIAKAWLDGNELDPKTEEWLDDNVSGWRDAEDAAPGRYVTQLGPNRVTIVPKATGLLKLRLVLMPSRDAITVPDILVEQYATVIGRGAAARALLTNNVTIANPTLGAGLNSEFDTAIAKLKLRIAKGQQDAPDPNDTEVFLMPISTYAADHTLNYWLRGVAMPAAPTHVYVSLHTGDPGNAGANEVSTGAWPAYV